MAIRIGIVGAGGRMGRAIGEAVVDAGHVLAGGVDQDGTTRLPDLARDSDVLIDFSTPAALPATLAAARAGAAALVVGTTGLSGADHAAIDAAAAGGLAVLQSANTSLGVNLIEGLVRQAAAALGEDWDIEVLEMHHRHKVDAPSGTALLLGHAAAEGRGRSPDDVDRPAPPQGHAREPGTIGYAALRGGSVAGDHQVIFATEGERIELGHRAESRTIFARGAVKAAAWLAGRPAGRYTMAEMLGL